MKVLFFILLLTIFSTLAFAQKPKEQTESIIIAGKGWSILTIGVKRKNVEATFGKGEKPNKFGDHYSVNYPEKGFQVFYTKGKNTLKSFYFYNKQYGFEHFSTATVKTDKDISWSSSAEDVIKAYGEPNGDFGLAEMRRIVFNGIDFRFESGIMVRIGVPGK